MIRSIEIFKICFNNTTLQKIRFYISLAKNCNLPEMILPNNVQVVNQGPLIFISEVRFTIARSRLSVLWKSFCLNLQSWYVFILLTFYVSCAYNSWRLASISTTRCKHLEQFIKTFTLDVGMKRVLPSHIESFLNFHWRCYNLFVLGPN
jgi:hypothetical protein